MIAAQQAGRRDGARWRADHPTATPTMREVMGGWLASRVDETPATDESPDAFARSAASFEAYRAAWCEGAGVDP